MAFWRARFQKLSPPHSPLIKIRPISAHSLFHRTLKYNRADTAFEKALPVKEARGTRESEEKSGPSSLHALALLPFR